MRRNPSSFALASLSLVCVLFLAACSSSSSVVLLYVTITPTSATAPVGNTATFTAQAYYSNGTIKDGTSLVAWSSSNPAVATIAGGLATGVSVGTATISASAAGTSGATATLTVTGALAPLMVTTTSLPTGTVNSAYPSTQLTATGGLSPYTWAVTTGALPAGLSLSTDGVISGTPTTATGSPFSFTVTATDSANTPNTATGNLSMTVNATTTSGCATGSESMLNGQYALVLKGFDNSGNPALVGGILAFNGAGVISSGVMDMNLNAGVSANLSVTSGSYSVGSDQRGCMAITTSAGTQNYRFSLGNLTSGVAAIAHVVDFDAGGPFTAGRMYLQSGGPFSASSFSGSYAFGGSSVQNSAVAVGKFGAVGFVTFDGTGNVTGGAQDDNANGTLDGSSSNTTWPASPIAITSGTYTVSANGRATLALTIGGTVANTILYAVSGSQVLLMTSDPQTTANIIAGDSFKQSGAPFIANPLSGTYIGYDSGLDPRSDIILLGPLTSGTSTLVGTQLRNDAGVFSSGAITGTYSVDATGRLLVAGSGNHQPVLYLVSATQAFFLNGNAGVDSGFFESQSGGPFSNTSASGTYAYGSIDPEAAGVSVNSGVAVFASPNLNTTEDDNSSGTLTIGGTQSFTYSVDATGLGSIPASCTLGTNCQTLFYLISPTKAVVIDTTSSNPKITIANK